MIGEDIVRLLLRLCEVVGQYKEITREDNGRGRSYFLSTARKLADRRFPKGNLQSMGDVKLRQSEKQSAQSCMECH